MTLTGKAKELFRQYYDKLPPHTPNHVPYATFMGLNPSFKWGVYQEFADSRKILISVDAIDDWTSWAYQIHMEDCLAPFFLAYSSVDDGFEFETREQARESAIKKLDELLNQ
jgi:hypothetical protein